MRHEALSSGRLQSARYGEEKPLFEQGRWRPVNSAVRGVDHQMFGTTNLPHQGDENSVKDTNATPADEAIMQGMAQNLGSLGVFPLKTVVDPVNNHAQNTTVIHTWDPMCEWEERPDLAHLALRQQKHVTRRPTLHRQPVNHCNSLNPAN